MQKPTVDMNLILFDKYLLLTQDHKTSGTSRPKATRLSKRQAGSQHILTESRNSGYFFGSPLNISDTAYFSRYLAASGADPLSSAVAMETHVVNSVCGSISTMINPP